MEPRPIDFQKEQELKKISQILHSWPAERVSFLLESLGSATPAQGQQRAAQKSEQLKDKLFQQTKAKIRQEISCYNPRFAKKVLTTMLDEVSQITDRADKLILMEGDIRAIYGKLDDKTKCMIAVLNELSAVEGRSVEADFGADILFDDSGNRGYAESYIEKNPDDPDVKVLATAYELAKLINDAE